MEGTARTELGRARCGRRRVLGRRGRIREVAVGDGCKNGSTLAAVTVATEVGRGWLSFLRDVECAVGTESGHERRGCRKVRLYVVYMYKTSKKEF